MDLGGFFDVLRGGPDGGTTEFSIELSAAPESLEPRYLPANASAPTELQVTFVLDRDANSFAVKRASLAAGDDVFAAARKAGRGYTVPHLTKEEREMLRVQFRHFLPGLQLSTRSRAREIPNSTVEKYFRADSAAMAWRNLFSLIGHVAPLREAVPRFGILGKTPSSELGPGGENLLRALRAADSSGIQLVEYVSRWVSEEFHMLQDLHLLDVDASGTVLALLGDESGGGFRGINIANMGEGSRNCSPSSPGCSQLLQTPPSLSNSLNSIYTLPRRQISETFLPTASSAVNGSTSLKRTANISS